MIYKDFLGKKLSMLWFGAMRLPLLDNGAIDEAQVFDMVKYAMANGVNYFDTAYPYHAGYSEIVLGKALATFPRDSFFFATKFPGHQASSTFNPAEVFEKQFRKCGVDYFDFYLLHNVNEFSIKTYLDPRWKILEYFKEQKRLGRIRHLGFSCHGGLDCMREFLDFAGADMEFCQIQLNWLDWTLQNAKAKVDLLNEHNIPVWVMEPVRGGQLCKLNDKDEAILKTQRPDELIPAWSFRFLQDIPGVTVILSGMSSMQQMRDNVATFKESSPLSSCERGMLFSIAEGMKRSVPCTGCRYCIEQCPLGLDIPLMMSTCSELRFASSINTTVRLEFLPADKQPSACKACGACARMCPQKIDIPSVIKELAEKLRTLPKWADLSKKREEEAQKLII